MNRKLSNCLEHQHSIAQPPFCPDRLLDISREPTRLVLKEAIFNSQLESCPRNACPQYAALSYCWGSGMESRQLKTTKATLSRHRERILDSEMSPVLRDA